MTLSAWRVVRNATLEGGLHGHSVLNPARPDSVPDQHGRLHCNPVVLGSGLTPTAQGQLPSCHRLRSADGLAPAAGDLSAQPCHSGLSVFPGTPGIPAAADALIWCGHSGPYPSLPWWSPGLRDCADVPEQPASPGVRAAQRRQHAREDLATTIAGLGAAQSACSPDEVSAQKGDSTDHSGLCVLYMKQVCAMVLSWLLHTNNSGPPVPGPAMEATSSALPRSVC